jgi:hypothetical protein
MCRRVALVRTDVPEERVASVIRVKITDDLRVTIAITGY